MKIALITDTHAGIRNDSPIINDAMSIFYKETFFPYLKDNDIKTVVHLGDVFDRRKYINFVTLNRLHSDFLQPMQDMNLDVHIIAGNHDCFFKNTNGLNALREIIDGKYPFHIYDKYATEVVFDDVPILLIPWICDDNREITMRTVNETRSQIAFGHLELSGFEMYKGAGSSHGDDPVNFRRFDILCSGHYHHRSSIGSIHYMGSPCEFTWSDYADPKGFHIFDTETRELTFIENPNTIFDKIFYDDSDKVIDDIMAFNPTPYKDKYLKVIIKNKSNPYWFDLMIEKLDKVGVAEMQVVEDHLNMNLEEDKDIVDEAEDTMTILKKYLNNMNSNTDKVRVETIVRNLYNKALSAD